MEEIINEHDQKMALVTALEEFHDASGWPLTKMADRIGVECQTLLNWLAGRNMPSRLAADQIKIFLAEYQYLK